MINNVINHYMRIILITTENHKTRKNSAAYTNINTSTSSASTHYNNTL